MATTRIIAMHRNKGCTAEQALKARLDYIKNPEKTREGELVTAFACHTATADAEFALARKEYFEITGRWREDEVIAYQIRQSFKPGEVTPEEAHQIGIELAERFLKGNHAFVIATHTDKKHVHNHLEWSAVTLDGMSKFRNFLGSGRAVARLSDQICMEHKLSVIEKPQHTGVSYNTWLGDKAIPSQRDTLRNVLDEVLAQKPGSFEALLAAMQQKGWEIKCGKQMSFRGPGEKRFKRLDTLGEAYTEETLRAVLAGERVYVPEKRGKTRRTPQETQVSLLVDVQAKLQAGKGAGYANWAKKFNLKQMAQTLNWLSDHGIQEFAELSAKVDAASAERRDLLKQARAAEKRLNEISTLRKQVVTYARTRKVFEAYGPLIYKRIYGDWSSPTMAPWRNLILNYSIQPIQQFANTRGKNATDSALIIDAMDLLHAGKLQGFCIVSSDSDFTRLAARLRESEMLVVGMGEKKTPASFISACDRFHYLDVLLSERIRSSNAQKVPATGFGEQTSIAAADDSDVKSGRDKAEVAKTISDLVAEHSDEAGWYFLGELGSRLQSRYPDFDSRNFGYAKLSDFVRSLGAYEFRSNVNPYNKNLQLVYIRKKEE